MPSRASVSAGELALVEAGLRKSPVRSTERESGFCDEGEELRWATVNELRAELNDLICPLRDG